jgi:hypothetical protein
MALFHIVVKARALVDAEDAVDAANHAAHDTADYGTDRTGVPCAFARASVNATDDALGLRCDGQRHGGGNGNNSDKTTDHDHSRGVC